MCCAGIGKTTLAHEICVRWARDRFLSEDFDVVVLIPLRCVQQRSLEEVMIEYTGEEAYQQLKKLVGSRCLIILEGLDEMAADHQKSDPFFIRLIKDCTVLEEATVMITSRPQACDKLKAGRLIEVVGFGANEIKEFIKKSFPNDEHSVSELLKQLNEYPHVKSLCYVPQNLVMIIDIFKCSQKKLPSRLTELYKLFLVMTLERHNMKEDEMYTSSDAPLLDDNSKNLSAVLPEIPINATGTVFLLCRLSFCGFFNQHVDMREKNWIDDEKKWKDPKIIFTIKDLKQCGIEITSQFDGFGLLKATHIHEVPRDTSTYNFSHLTIQEFLSSLYISLLPQQEQLRLINEHFHDFPNIFIFLCGLTRLQCNEMYQITYYKLMSPDDVILAVRCIYESDCPVQSTVPFTLDMSSTHNVLNEVLPYDCYCISYMISHYPISQLIMERCYIDDTGAEMLAKYYSEDSTTVQSLQRLDLTRNRLTAVGMVHVMSIVMTSKPHY